MGTAGPCPALLRTLPAKDVHLRVDETEFVDDRTLLARSRPALGRAAQVWKCFPRLTRHETNESKLGFSRVLLIVLGTRSPSCMSLLRCLASLLAFNPGPDLRKSACDWQGRNRWLTDWLILLSRRLPRKSFLVGHSPQIDRSSPELQKVLVFNHCADLAIVALQKTLGALAQWASLYAHRRLNSEDSGFEGTQLFSAVSAVCKSFIASVGLRRVGGALSGALRAGCGMSGPLK